MPLRPWVAMITRSWLADSRTISSTGLPVATLVEIRSGGVSSVDAHSSSFGARCFRSVGSYLPFALFLLFPHLCASSLELDGAVSKVDLVDIFTRLLVYTRVKGIDNLPPLSSIEDHASPFQDRQMMRHFGLVKI